LKFGLSPRRDLSPNIEIKRHVDAVVGSQDSSKQSLRVVRVGRQQIERVNRAELDADVCKHVRVWERDINKEKTPEMHYSSGDSISRRSL
jgi:hypothetical protein